MDPLYEIAARLLEQLDPEWGPPPTGRVRPGWMDWLRVDWLTRHLPRLPPSGVQRLLGPLSSAARSMGGSAWAALFRLRWLRRSVLRRAIHLNPPPGQAHGVQDPYWAPVLAALAAESQRAPAPTSIHVRRILVTRLLHASPARAIAATRLVGRYPRYYEELALEIAEEYRRFADPLAVEIARSNDRISPHYDASALAASAEDLADRLVADYEFAAAVANLLQLPKPFSLVLSDELREIRDSRLQRIGPSPPVAGPPASPIDRAHEQRLMGLALSGGGIRSATFGLGVLQALAHLDLLRQIDYISTVSGGGYIGSWLAAWIKRLRGGVREVQQRLSPARAALPTEGDARPVRMLREFSNYLTPSVGALSADTWTMVSVWLRNTLLNQLVLVAFCAAALLVPWLLLVSWGDRPAETWVFDRGVPVAMQWVVVGALVVAVWTIVSALRDFDDDDVGPDGGPVAGLGWSDTGIAVVVGGALLVGSWGATVAVVALTGNHWTIDPRVPMPDVPVFAWGWFTTSEWRIAVLTSMALLGGLLVVSFGGRYASCLVQSEQVDGHVRAWPWAALRLALCAPVPAVAGGLLVAVAHRLAPLLSGWWGGADPVVYQLVVLPPLLMEVLATVVVLHIGLLGRWLPDERREWWSRLGAHQLRLAVAWAVVCATALLVPAWISGGLDWPKIVSGVTWAATTVGGVIAARMSETGGNAKPSLSTRLLEWLARAAPALFVFGLLVGVSLLLRVVLDPSHVRQVAWAIAALGATGALLSWRVDINEFSMHHFYKNRLVRSYLGASRARRLPNRFTGFDPNDDLKLARLLTTADAKQQEQYVGPFPVINTALNLTKGSELAWQERKAESFVFTPLVCGYELGDNRRSPRRNLRRAGYRPTAHFAYPGGPTLGTAAAISGAAASPNMGYHSSPAAAFLMTVFNVRLGWWVGNPRFSALGPVGSSPWRRSSPPVGGLYLLKELFGRTDNQSRYVSLSDGGHFENLGIYELVRRRCRFIMAVDAEADPELAMGGLAGVIRKCRTDFGVTIEIDTKALRHGSEPRSHYAVGTIQYPERPGEKDWGWLLYLKSSVTGNEPADVGEYATREKAFPHQPTSDQWFNESQFESYRMLGYHVGEEALAVAARPVAGVAPTLEAIFKDLRTRCTLPERAVQS